MRLIEARIWYCRNRRCRGVLKTEPPHAVVYTCTCKVPKLPSGPTLVSWPDTTGPDTRRFPGGAA